MPEEVHNMSHPRSNVVDVVSPNQSVVNKDTKKLETGDLLNFRAREVDVEGWWINFGSWGTNEPCTWSYQHSASAHYWSSSYWQGQDKVEVRSSEGCSCCQHKRL